MKVASALVRAYQPLPGVAEAAVRKAMQRAELRQAATVFLFMSRDMAYCAKAAIVAAARVAGCLQVFGSTAYGIFTEDDWLLEQSGVAALVLDQAMQPADEQALTLSLTGNSTLPHDWQTGRPRFGLLDSNATVWAHGRIAEQCRAEISLAGLRSHQAVVTGLRPLGETLRVEAANGYDVQRIAGKPAIDSLIRTLHPESRERPPLHRMAALRQLGEPGIPILSSNADGSLTLGEPIQAGEPLIWAMRQTLQAEKFMREAMTAAVDPMPNPDFALMFSCIGRGPLFYGGDDLDLATVRERYPTLPIIGAYGGGQIAALAGANHLYQNTAMTLLLEAPHV